MSVLWFFMPLDTTNISIFYFFTFYKEKLFSDKRFCFAPNNKGKYGLLRVVLNIGRLGGLGNIGNIIPIILLTTSYLGTHCDINKKRIPIATTNDRRSRTKAPRRNKLNRRQTESRGQIYLHYAEVRRRKSRFRSAQSSRACNIDKK